MNISRTKLKRIATYSYKTDILVVSLSLIAFCLSNKRDNYYTNIQWIVSKNDLKNNAKILSKFQSQLSVSKINLKKKNLYQNQFRRIILTFDTLFECSSYLTDLIRYILKLWPVVPFVLFIHYELKTFELNTLFLRAFVVTLVRYLPREKGLSTSKVFNMNLP